VQVFFSAIDQVFARCYTIMFIYGGLPARHIFKSITVHWIKSENKFGVCYFSSIVM